MSRQWLDRAFLAAVTANLLPVVWFRFLPTRDGPAHVLSATWIREMWTGHAPGLEGLVTWNPAPVPNWIGHAFMALSGAIVGPWMAERLLLALIVVALPLALNYALRAVTPRSTGLEFVALPLVWGTHLHWGFYNFTLSLAAYLICVGYWWRHRRDVSARHVSVWALLLVVTYFCSLLALVHSLASVALLVMFEPARRLYAWRLALTAALPALVLWGLFLVLEPVGRHVATAFPSPLWAAANLGRLDILRSGFGSDHWPTVLSAAALWTLVAFWLIKRPPIARVPSAWPWLALVVFDVCVVFAAPTSIGGGTLITPRQAVFAILVLILCLSSQPTRLPRPAVIGGVAICLALGLHASRWHFYDRYSRSVENLIEASPDALINRTLFATAVHDGLRNENGVWPTAHAGAYVAVARGSILVNQYELLTTHFPLVAARLAGDGRTLRAEVNGPVDAVLLWGGSLEDQTLIATPLLDPSLNDCRLLMTPAGDASLFSCRGK